MKIIIKQLGLLVLIGLIAIGCDKNPGSHGGDHTDTDGFILKDENGNGLYREFKGAIDINNINLIVGDTLELYVHFLDHEGNEIQHGEDEEDHEDGATDMPVAMMPRTGKITLLQLDGVLTPEEYKKCVEVGIDGCNQVYEIQKKALEEKYFSKGDQ